MAGRSGRKPELSAGMTLRAFDNGYWYAEELRAFAIGLKIPQARKLRKDQLEAAVKSILSGKAVKPGAIRVTPRPGPRDLDRGLRLDLPVVHYTSNRDTKRFLEQEAAKIEPGFRRASGTRYLLNRWREEQIAAGRRITYRDLVMKAIALNKSKRRPLRVEHARYINFVSDYMAENTGARHEDAVRAWHQIKALDAPKTYAEWAQRFRK